jgi:hypothetical protein
MNNILDKYSPLMMPEVGGGGDATPPAGSNGGTEIPPAAGTIGGSQPGEGDQAPLPPAGPYRPQGLPETMLGKDDQETMDKMAVALADYRDRETRDGVPDSPDAYQAFDLANVDDGLKPHLEGLAKDPLFKAVADVAMAERVPVGSMQKIVTTLYSEAMKAGIFEGFVDDEAERQQLIPTTAVNLPKAQQDQAIDARLQANVDFLTLLAKPGADGKSALDPKDAQHAEMMLIDTAAGNRFLEFFRAQMTGEGRAGPLAGNGMAAGSGPDARAALRARAAAPEMQPGHPNFNRAAWDQLQEDYRKLIPEG